MLAKIGVNMKRSAFQGGSPSFLLAIYMLLLAVGLTKVPPRHIIKFVDHCN